MNISATKTFQGAWRISAVIDGFLVQKQYMGYTKREAIAQYKEESEQ